MSSNHLAKTSVTWSSRFAFLMAAIGSAVGLGNIWRFPYLAGENGGGSFVVVYLVSVLLIGIPILLAELLLGRAGGDTPVLAMRKIMRDNQSSKGWNIIGWVGTFTALAILSYYAIIGGWTLRYFVLALQGAFAHQDKSAMTELFTSFTANPYQLLIYHALFILISILIVVGGVRKSIEKSVIIMMPLLFFSLVLLVVYAATTHGFQDALAFIFSFKTQSITWKGVLDAVGQAFFSLSVASGAMMTYAAYLSKKENLSTAAVTIAASDTLVAILAGLAIFPFVFSEGIAPGSGPGLAFITLPLAFAKFYGGSILAAIFFFLLALSAITSAISMLEPFVSWCISLLKIKRSTATWFGGILAGLVGVPSLLSFNIWSKTYPLGWLGIHKNFFALLDFFLPNIAMLSVGLLIAIYVGYVLKHERVANYLGINNPGFLFRLWRFSLKSIVPAAIIVLFCVRIYTQIA